MSSTRWATLPHSHWPSIFLFVSPLHTSLPYTLPSLVIYCLPKSISISCCHKIHLSLPRVFFSFQSERYVISTCSFFFFRVSFNFCEHSRFVSKHDREDLSVLPFCMWRLMTGCALSSLSLSFSLPSPSPSNLCFTHRFLFHFIPPSPLFTIIIPLLSSLVWFSYLLHSFQFPSLLFFTFFTLLSSLICIFIYSSSCSILFVFSVSLFPFLLPFLLSARQLSFYFFKFFIPLFFLWVRNLLPSFLPSVLPLPFLSAFII